MVKGWSLSERLVAVGLACLIVCSLDGCSRGERTKQSISGQWNLHLSSWIGTNSFVTLDIREENGIITGTYPDFVSKRLCDIRGMWVNDEIELRWSDPIESNPGVEAGILDYTLKGHTAGNKMSGKYHRKVTWGVETP
jgi:hypothetical protein